MIFLILGLVLFVAGGLGLAWYMGWKDNTFSDPLVGSILGGSVILVTLVVLGFATVPSSTVPDGCYRVSSTTSSGVGVGVNPNGSGVTVVPITTSGKTYTPIACP